MWGERSTRNTATPPSTTSRTAPATNLRRGYHGRGLGIVVRLGEDPNVDIPCEDELLRRVEANAAAADVVLSADDLREIEAVASPDRVAGARGADAYLARVDA